MLRVTTSGGIPPDNPFQGANSARCNATGRSPAGTICQETYAWGLRNPFRLAFDPNAAGTRFFINDVGQNTWEEIDDGKAGADYGWNVREGHCATNSTTDCGAPPAGMTNPIFDYGARHRLRGDHRRRLRAERRVAVRVPRPLPVRRLRLRPDPEPDAVSSPAGCRARSATTWARSPT